MAAFKLSKRNILIISPEPWDYIKVSKHHYARELLKRGHRIFFLNPPDPDNYRKLTLTETDEMPGLIVANYPGHIRGYRFLSSSIRIWLNKRFLKKLEQRSKCRVDVIWNFENSRFYDMKFAGSRLKIYHQVDLNQNFHVKQAASQSDICFCTSEVIKRVIEPWNSKVYKIHHGVQPDVFSNSLDLQRNTRITATYIGNLDIKYLDINLLKSLTEAFPSVWFNFVGNYSSNRNTYKLLSNYPNVTFIGPVNSDSIKEYLTNSDILLVCYKAEEYKEQLSSPHKFMEYFASGKIIVATYTEEYKDKSDLLVMSNNNNQYIKLFKKVVDNIQEYNASDLMQKRRAFAADNTYEKQVNRINEKLKAIGIAYEF